MNHSYEEIRGAALDVVAKRERTCYEPSQYEHISRGIAEVLERREQPARPHGHDTRLSSADSELFLEVFWDLFRQGIITLGCDDGNREFPFCRLSRFGKRILENQNTYFFHDVSSYAEIIRSEVPDIHDITLVYLQEAMQAFRSGCLLSASVMLGVATEHTFLLLMETIEKSEAHKNAFAAVGDQLTILRKVTKFKNILEQQRKQLPSDVSEDLDTHFTSILSVIRTFRNESGHPTGKIIDREQMYVLLNLFGPYCKKVYQLRDYFS